MHSIPLKRALPQTETIHEAEIRQLREDFRHDVKDFLTMAGIDECPSFQIESASAHAEPVFILTGASFSAYNSEAHGNEDTHAHYSHSNSYLMNNTAALLERLMDGGHRVLAHIKNAPEQAESIIKSHPNGHRVTPIHGDLADTSILKTIYCGLAEMSEQQPISNIRMGLYQSFAQGNGSPFNPIHRESIFEVERAASRRLRFVYNMATLGYDLLENKGLDDLRIVSLSALAANRATYGLLADAADKFMNDLTWRTFHLEANVSTGKNVTIYQVNPGITTACDVYRNPQAHELVIRESIADGFPMDDDVLMRKKPLPQLSSHDVAWVSDALLRTPDGQDPNESMPSRIKELLYGGFEPKDIKERFQQAIQVQDDYIAVDPDRILPEHIITPGTTYGSLPKAIEPGSYKRISLTPLGQRF